MDLLSSTCNASSFFAPWTTKKKNYYLYSISKKKCSTGLQVPSSPDSAELAHKTYRNKVSFRNKIDINYRNINKYYSNLISYVCFAINLCT